METGGGVGTCVGVWAAGGVGVRGGVGPGRGGVQLLLPPDLLLRVEDGLVKADELLGTGGEPLKVRSGDTNSVGLLLWALLGLIRAEGLLRDVEELESTRGLMWVFVGSVSTEELLRVVVFVVRVTADELLRGVVWLVGGLLWSGRLGKAFLGLGRIKGRLDIAEEVKVVG